MNQDLHQAEKLTLSEKRLMQRHSRSAMAIMAMHTLLCVVYFQLGYMHIALSEALVLVSLVWISLLAYQLLMATGVTLNLREPSLSLPLILYFIGVFMVSGYYVDEFRLSVVTLFFAALLMVSFRLSGKVMIAVAFLASAAYALMLWLALMDRWVQLSLSVELLQWLVFAMISVSFAVTGGGVNRLRNALADKNRDLANAVEKVREMAIRDDLTGLFNRRHLLDILERQRALAGRKGVPFAVCYVTWITSRKSMTGMVMTGGTGYCASFPSWRYRACVTVIFLVAWEARNSCWCCRKVTPTAPCWWLNVCASVGVNSVSMPRVARPLSACPWAWRIIGMARVSMSCLTGPIRVCTRPSPGDGTRARWREELIIDNSRVRLAGSATQEAASKPGTRPLAFNNSTTPVRVVIHYQLTPNATKCLVASRTCRLLPSTTLVWLSVWQSRVSLAPTRRW